MRPCPNVGTDPREVSPMKSSSLHGAAIKDLRRIPGVGPSIARDLYDQGFRRVDDLKGADPAAMYARQEQIQGCHVDRCWLYVAKCAVYFAETITPRAGQAQMVELERLTHPLGSGLTFGHF
jgi:hypothetical protein